MQESADPLVSTIPKSLPSATVIVNKLTLLKGGLVALTALTETSAKRKNRCCSVVHRDCGPSPQRKDLNNSELRRQRGS